MPEQFTDEILGTIRVRRNPLSRSIRMRLSARGEIVATVPNHTPLIFIKQTVKNSRGRLIEMLAEAGPEQYIDGQALGQSHTLAVVSSELSHEVRISLSGRKLVVTLPHQVAIQDATVQALIRDHVTKILRKEAKAYLPRRLATLADRYGYAYSNVRFPHATSRWGSCSTSGTISLNIALMKLPLELIDYVIVHELAHTKHMNHSAEFWEEVSEHDPRYKLHRRQMKSYSPVI